MKGVVEARARGRRHVRDEGRRRSDDRIAANDCIVSLVADTQGVDSAHELREMKVVWGP